MAPLPMYAEDRSADERHRRGETNTPFYEAYNPFRCHQWERTDRLAGELCCAAMITGTALRHTRIGDPVLF